VGSQDSADVARDTARDLSGLAGELAALKGDAALFLALFTTFALKLSEKSHERAKRLTIRRLIAT
jgi:hypothetical protein